MGERKLPILYTQEVVGIRKTMILSLGLFVASGFLLLFFLISYGKTRKESEEYIHIRQTYTAIREDIFPALAAPVEKQEPKQLPYITADYAGLRELNPDIVGWIAIPDTPISYPVMQAADNQLYLKRDSSGKSPATGLCSWMQITAYRPLIKTPFYTPIIWAKAGKPKCSAPYFFTKKKNT